MNLKNKSGVTLSLLVATIIVMFILFGITYTTGMDLIRDSQKNKMKTMLYMVQSRGEILLDDYKFNHDGEELSTVSNSDIEKELGGTYLTDVSKIESVGYNVYGSSVPSKDSMIYCMWNSNDLENQGIDTKNLANGDTIIVEYDIQNETVDVASVKGFSKDGVAIHKLEDFR